MWIVNELPAENGQEVVQHLFLKNIGISISDEEITAIRRIPGRKGYQRPILARLKNNSAKISCFETPRCNEKEV